MHHGFAAAAGQEQHAGQAVLGDRMAGVRRQDRPVIRFCLHEMLQALLHPAAAQEGTDRIGPASHPLVETAQRLFQAIGSDVTLRQRLKDHFGLRRVGRQGTVQVGLDGLAGAAALEVEQGPFQDDFRSPTQCVLARFQMLGRLVVQFGCRAARAARRCARPLSGQVIRQTAR